MNCIYFYTTKGPHGCFSNFSRHPFFLDGKFFQTSEHFYQASKFLKTDPSYAEEIRNAPNPKAAAALGRTVRNPPMDPDWDDIKDNVMRRVVMYKFTMHKSCRKTLLSTENAKLVEESDVDSYWGCGADGKGKNMLGIILMETREILKKNYQPD